MSETRNHAERPIRRERRFDPAGISEIQAALKSAADLAWMVVGNASHRPGIDVIADLMAFITARDGIVGIFQGSGGDRTAGAGSPIHRDGGSDDDYNAYSYMVLTARAKPHARLRVPAVIHADGTARLQIVREETDAVTFAYLKALGRRTGSRLQ